MKVEMGGEKKKKARAHPFLLPQLFGVTVTAVQICTKVYPGDAKCSLVSV